MFAADARKHTPGKNAEKENFSMRINNYGKRKNSFPNAPLTIVLKESFSKPVAYNSNWNLLPHWKHLMAPFLPNW